MRKERRDPNTKGPRFEGKPREEAHPFDRKDGTGKARRGDRKGGNSKGTWGNDKKVAEGEEEPKKDENAEEKPKEEEKVQEPEPVVEEEEEEEVGFTLDDFLAQKEANSKGLLTAAQKREHEKMTAKNVQVNDTEKERVTQIDSHLAGRDTYAIKKSEGAELLGFGAVNYDDEFESRGARGGRGGRGSDRGGRGGRGGRGADRGGRDNRPRGGRKGGKLVVDDNDFPAL